MIWQISHRADPVSRAIADRHYNRQSIGHPQIAPPGRVLVLRARSRRGREALWITSFQFPEFCKHAWAGAWVCTAFRNEGVGLSSDLIRQAIGATRAYMGEPPTLGMVTFVQPEKVRKKNDPGYCFICAGFRPCGQTGKGYLAFQLLPDAMPEPVPPLGILI
jgi:hypothetical protein